MPKVVRFERYGGIDVLQVVEEPRPVPGPGRVLVEVRAAAVNPGEARVREGEYAQRWPATFPSGQGSDEVIGYTDERASHAEYVVVEQAHLIPRPATVSWEAAGSLYVAGTTAYAAVRAVSLAAGDTVVVSAAAGGVGSIAVQLAKHAGATVIGLASEPNHEWLASHGVIPVSYGEGVEERIRAASDGRVDAFIDTVGGGYVDLAIALGVAPQRIDTIIDWAAAQRYGVKTEGNAAGAGAEVLAELAGLVGKGILEIPIAKVYPLDEVQAAYRELARGKIVLRPYGSSMSA